VCGKYGNTKQESDSSHDVKETQKKRKTAGHYGSKYNPQQNIML